MPEEEHKISGISSPITGDSPKSSGRSANRWEKKKEKRLLKKTVEAEESQDVSRKRLMEENSKPNDAVLESGWTKRNKKLLKEAANVEKNEITGMSALEERNLKSNDERVKKQKNRRNKGLLKETNKSEDELEGDGESIPEESNPKSTDGGSDNGANETENALLGGANEREEELENRKSKRKQRLLEEAAKAEQRGVCYLSRIPPHMDHVKLRQILSQYGEILRIYLVPEGPAAQVPRKRVNRKRDGGFQEQVFSEGWVEFTKKSVAKRVANMLNGEQIGGRKRSSFYYDLWNIKYLRKFKWDDLTEEIAYKSAVREQKLALEISAAKRERDFYLSKVDKSRALSSIEERLKKKQKVQKESGTHYELPVSQQPTKVFRQFPQKRPVADNIAQSKPRLSKDILAGVFGGS
ncbi:hypothetical protein Pint_02846 [Pistacia integerrima]|uniref:Uncharacterized protein n=1 Tax=Pistacia integerrima TaxID=434235 RepID=A0ACC0ZPN2_9ROSI|nr:hypothetical protein Pint_02846 [Pistacia integerrima]